MTKDGLMLGLDYYLTWFVIIKYGQIINFVINNVTLSQVIMRNGPSFTKLYGCNDATRLTFF